MGNARRDVSIQLAIITLLIASFMWLWRRAFPGSIPVSGLAHGLISFTLYYSLPFATTHNLRVGPSY